MYLYTGSFRRHKEGNFIEMVRTCYEGVVKTVLNINSFHSFELMIKKKS